MLQIKPRIPPFDVVRCTQDQFCNDVEERRIMIADVSLSRFYVISVSGFLFHHILPR